VPAPACVEEKPQNIQQNGRVSAIKNQQEVKQMSIFRLATVIPMVITLLVPWSADASLVFTLADLEGDWEMNVLGSPGPWWARGLVTVQSDGTISGTSHGSNNSSAPLSGTFAIANDGIISASGGAFTPSFRCAMDSGKRIAACTTTPSGGEKDLQLFTRKAAGYLQGDLEGTWDISSIVSGTGAPWWSRGAVEIDANGTIKGTLEYSDDDPEDVSGLSFTLGSNGVILSPAIDPDFRAVMDSRKSVVVGTSTWGSGAPQTTEITVWTRKSDSYSLADLVGTWQANEVGAPGAYWARGMVTIDANGNLSATMDNSNNNTESRTGTMSIASDGIITVSSPDLPPASTRCTMDAAKDFVVCNYISNNQVRMLILTSYGGRTLTVTRSGTGSGSVMANSGALSWAGDIGIAGYMTGAQVILTANPDPFSTFGGWAGDCTPSGSSCLVTMAADRYVTGHFTLTSPPKAKIGTTGYISLNAAYTDAPTPGPTTILALDAELPEDLAMGSGKEIVLIGGYNTAFNARTGNPTILKGLLTIGTGSLTVDGLAVR
jgi:hypothetical protein